jgi:hypothetical protein
MMLACVSCTTVPKNGAMLADSVTLGIQRMESQTEAMIETLAAVERNVLDERWEELYRRSEALFREKSQIPSNVTLDETQRIAVATLSARARDTILAVIADKEVELKSQSLKNANQVIEANRAVRDYLMSVEDLDAARQRTNKTLAELSGLDVSKLVNTTQNALKKLP